MELNWGSAALMTFGFFLVMVLSLVLQVGGVKEFLDLFKGKRRPIKIRIKAGRIYFIHNPFRRQRSMKFERNVYELIEISKRRERDLQIYVWCLSVNKKRMIHFSKYCWRMFKYCPTDIVINKESDPHELVRKMKRYPFMGDVFVGSSARARKNVFKHLKRH